MIVNSNDSRLEICLKISIIQDPRLSFEGIGYYALLEAGLMDWESLPTHIEDEFNEIGYFKGEVK